MTHYTQATHSIPSEEELLRRIRWIRRLGFVVSIVISAIVGGGFYIVLKVLVS